MVWLLYWEVDGLSFNNEIEVDECMEDGRWKVDDVATPLGARLDHYLRY